MRFRAVLAIIVLSIAFQGCSDSDPTTPKDPESTDTTPPGTVTDLRLESVSDLVLEVVWTAPGDDGADGTATTYDVRFSTTPITEGSWSSCTPAPFIPDPAVAGTQQTAQVSSPPKPEVYVALKTADEVPNWSELSNVLHVNTDPGVIQIRQLVTDGSDDHPSVNDGVVCWISRQGSEEEIYVANVRVASPAPTKLTGNGGEKGFPSNHGSERIVWQGREDGLADWEIFVYDKYSDPPRYQAFTDDEIDDTHPLLAGAGDFAWLHGHILHEAVHYWNEGGQLRSVLSDGCCPTSSWYAESLTVHDHQVVWRAVDRVGSEGYEAKSWEGGVTDISDEVGCPLSIDYSLHDGAVAFEYLHESNDWIALWDGVKPLRTIARGYEPSLYAGTIAFEVWDGRDWEIHYWDGSQVIEITDNDYNDTQPSLDDGIIAWVGRPSGSLDQIFYARVED